MAHSDSATEPQVAAAAEGAPTEARDRSQPPPDARGDTGHATVRTQRGCPLEKLRDISKRIVAPARRRSVVTRAFDSAGGAGGDAECGSGCCRSRGAEKRRCLVVGRVAAVCQREAA